ncbi:MAG: helix-turn-helix domain-containing protein [Candidatus Krumholzibacteriia bacterium]
MAGNIVRVPPDLPARLRKEREQRYLTQGELAEKAGVHARTVYELEAGRRDRILAKTLMALAEALEIPVHDFLNGDPDPENPSGATGSSDDATTQHFPWKKILAIAAVPVASFLLIFAYNIYHQVDWRFDREGGTIEARDGLFGRVLWSRDLGDEIRICQPADWADDILLVGLGGLHLDGGRLLALDLDDGTEIWSIAPDSKEMAAAFGGDSVYGGGFGCREVLQADLAGDGEPELIVHFFHTKWYPNALCLVSRDGSLNAQYANRGSLYDIEVVDLDGDGCDEVIAAGTNNAKAYQGATVFILDADHWRGAAVDPVTQPGYAVPDSSLYRLVLPAWPEPYMGMLQITRLEASKIRTFRNGTGEVTIQVDVGAHGIAAVVLDMDSRLFPAGIGVTDHCVNLLRRVGLEDDATARGILDPAVQEAWLDGYVHFQVGQSTSQIASH